MGHTVGDVARMAGVSVRTLHHYDAIGLLDPSGRSESGYRLYTDQDLERLQQILFFRELGFPLEAIKRIVRAPEFDRKAALLAQRKALVEKGARLEAMVKLIDLTIDSIAKGKAMNEKEMFVPFDHAAFEEEVKERWGNTDAYATSARRVRGYTKDDWTTIRKEAEASTLALANALSAGAAPTDDAVMDLAEEARLHIDRWFYPCSLTMHVALGEMYVTDPRFAQNYERRHPGLARFVCDAIRANASRQKAAPESD